MKKCISVSFLLLFSGCSVTPKATSVKDLPDSPEAKTGILVPVNLRTHGLIAAENGCTLSFIRDGDMVKTYDVDLQPGKTSVIADLPAGVYAYRKLYCGSRKWSFEGRARFQVFPGKISLLEAIDVNITGARNLKFTADREQSRLAVYDLFVHLPGENRNSVVSGYTGQMIEFSRLEKPARFKKWDYADGSGNPVSNTLKDWPNFKMCYVTEWKTNPLQLGNLSIETSYENAVLQEVKVLDTWNTYTPAFLECAKSVLTQFRPKALTQVRYTVYL